MPRGRALFLERRGYRLRRMMDAARLLPVLGVFLFMLPILWGPLATAARSTAVDGVYLFLVWPALIFLAYLISRRLAPVTEEAGDAWDESGARR
ncbi:MAG: hypothetical protein KGH84_05040 [Paracoccaceae bacterium]|nr:hypothetical protein [Paracoccaceae bacterium]